MENASEMMIAAPASPTFATSNFGTAYNGHTLWIACETVLCVLTASILYIICCLVRFTWSRKTLNVPIRYRMRYQRIMAYICLLASVATIIKFLIDQWMFFYAWKKKDDEICEILYDISNNVLFSIAYLSVYGFLWVKQWLFYKDPAVVGILYSRNLVLFSKVFGPVVLLLGVMNVTANIIPVRYKAGYSYANPNDTEALANDKTYLGCVSVYEYTDSDQVWPLMSYAAITAIFQTTLLVLFAYPILKQKLDIMAKTRRKMCRCSSSEDGVQKGFLDSSLWKTKQSISSTTKESDCDKTTVQDENLKSVQEEYTAKMNATSPDAIKPIKRAIFWTIICISTDFSLFVVFACLGRGTPLILITIAQDIDIFFNILCLLATYNNWQYILFPLCKRTIRDDDLKSSIAVGTTKTSSSNLNV